ncbi:MAG: hypothetical protein HRT73_14360, partial [Flavobacteriales bacterium]|nr:hypothetical protein [Flavobacteriales bacterium]
LSQTKKRITYEYDLISGNVNKVNYQAGRNDEFYHRYCYDADNRITKVETSRDDYIWDTDAKYFYYEHGPLARCEIGEKHVAGTDYAYTLQGWLKGVNSSVLNTSYDIGKDADITQNGLNRQFATDAYGYSLGYYKDDYTAVNPSANTMIDNFLASVTNGSSMDNAGPSLYNGNIRHMTIVMRENLKEAVLAIHGIAYQYDQANRIRKSNVFTSTDIVNVNNFDNTINDGRYQTEYHYDLNGNITQLKRSGIDNTDPLNPFGPGVGVFDMDDMSYKYANNGNGRNEHDLQTSSYDYRDGSVAAPPVSPNYNTNQLTQVIDANGAINGGDFPGTGTNNYHYDNIGQLIKDDSEEIENITWDVYNKIETIRYSNPNHQDLAFKYDASGNRIAKIVKEKDASNNIKTADNWISYFYQRDASGNIMAVYKQNIDLVSGSLYKATNTLIERDIYGSSRLGTDNIEQVTETYYNATIGGGSGLPGSVSVFKTTGVNLATEGLLTISDESGSEINMIIKANDKEALTLNIPTTFSINGDTISGGGEYTVTPGQIVNLQISGSSFNSNLNGRNTLFLQNNETTLQYSALGPITISSISATVINYYTRVIGEKVYEKSNHLSNVLVTLSDRKFPTQTTTGIGNTYDFYQPNVLSYSDYYPFGSLLPNRYSGGNEYRYGFNGMEGDDEVKSEGNSYTTYFRSYDPRLGK